MISQALQRSKLFKTPSGPVVLIILDGVGIGKNDESNAVYMANTPFLDSLKEQKLYTTLKAHGTAVGMPSDDDMGNSEVGHNTLGAGRVFEQGSSLVKKSIESGALYQNKNWLDGLKNCQDHASTLHFIGLLSDGNVHNHIDYQMALIKKAAETGIKRIRLHCLLDGRDVDSRSALRYIAQLNTLITTLKKDGCDIDIASGGGRMITTMDRYDADWTIVERGWKAHVLGEANAFDSVESAVTEAYKDSNVSDQYIQPFVITKNGSPIGAIEDNDTVFFTNFRGDRSIEITKAFESNEFHYFDRKRKPNVFYAGMMQYDGDLQIPKKFLVDPPAIDRSLSSYLCANELRSFSLSETQKFGHVTYFWNGNRSGYVNEALENYIEIKSDLIPFDQAPIMKAKEITEKAIEIIKNQKIDFACINYPNGDMVGHTGNFKATVKSVEAVDTYCKQLVDAIISKNGIAVILADHGNADEMFTIKNGEKLPKTSHTLNPVPFAIVANNLENLSIRSVKSAGLANVAATLCNLLGLEAPEDYAESLIKSDI